MTHKCANNGCEATFTDEENNDTACIYHSGTAIFHEGLKGWSCCKKRVISFEEFMQIPGCSCGAHVPEQKKQPTSQPEIKKPSPAPAPTAAAPPTQSPSPAPTPKPAPAPASKPAPTPKPVEEEEEDAPNAAIAPGTKCKRLGCNQIFHDERSRTEECIYHPGVPVFHEGSKGYTCCRMVGDFEEFLRMPGCKRGKHRFIESKKEKEAASSQQVACRHDWYQMGANVVVCVYAKGVDKTKSSVSFEPRRLSIDLAFPDGKRFSKVFELSQEIDPTKSKFDIFSTKVEIKLFKTDGAQWATLE